MSPYFSIIIPMYNRERFIGRAIDSCLKQDFENFEIIVVDDGSKDKSAELVKNYTDPRIKLICHETNCGVGTARNTGVGAATGEWIVCFDSDDEILSGSLSIIYRRICEVDGSISRLQFMVQMEMGDLSPDPPLKDEFWDYISYIRWMERHYGHPSETLPVVRRVTFEKVKYYNHKILEQPYHLDFMKQFKAWSFPDVVRLYHQDADNQLSEAGGNHTIEGARYQRLGEELLLKNHGEALRIYAPQIYRRHISHLATLCFLSGNRLKGIKYSFLPLASNVFSLRKWVILLFGLLGAKPLVWLRSFRARLIDLRASLL